MNEVDGARVLKAKKKQFMRLCPPPPSQLSSPATRRRRTSMVGGRFNCVRVGRDPRTKGYDDT